VFLLLLGVTQDGLYCIRFGLVTADTDLEELIGMVVATGKDVEESSKVSCLENIIHLKDNTWNYSYALNMGS